MPWIEGPDGVLYYYLITKPLWLLEFLSKLEFHIFSWTIDVGGPIETAVDWVIDWVNAVADWFEALRTWFEEFRQEVIEFITQVPEWFNEVWQFIQNVWDSITGVIDKWWDGMIDTVQGWIDTAKDFVIGLIDDLQGVVTRIGTNLDNFFTSTLPTLVSKFEIGDLIATALAPFRDLFNFLENVRGELIEFFNDPWAWLYNKFDEFFERFW